MAKQISYCFFKEGSMCTNLCEVLPSSAFEIVQNGSRYCGEKAASDELITCSEAQIVETSIVLAGDEIEEDSW